ncbi:Uncharacterised protein [Bordetella pertussis]|nr:Uncharacterised protein [Bordetella pertussis]
MPRQVRTRAEFPGKVRHVPIGLYAYPAWQSGPAPANLAALAFRFSYKDLSP